MSGSYPLTDAKRAYSSRSTIPVGLTQIRKRVTAVGFVRNLHPYVLATTRTGMEEHESTHADQYRVCENDLSALSTYATELLHTITNAERSCS